MQPNLQIANGYFSLSLVKLQNRDLPIAIDYAFAIYTFDFYFTNYFRLGISPPSLPIFIFRSSYI